MTIAEFAEHLGVTTRAVDKWEARGASITPRPELQRALDTVLSGADPAARARLFHWVDGFLHPVRPPGDAPPQGQLGAETGPDSSAGAGPQRSARPVEGLTRTERYVGAVEAHDVAQVVAATHRFESLDHRFGGGYARRAAVEYLGSTVATLLSRTASDRVRAALMAAAAELTYKTGAMAYDCGMHDAARTYFVGALDLARSGGDRALSGKVFAIMSHQANFLGRHAEAVDLARAAKSGAAGAAPPRVHAMYCAMEARALSARGDEAAATRAVREAESAFARQGGEDEPPWIRYFDVAELHDEFGHCFRDLGKAEESARNLDIALATSSSAYPRSRTFSRLILASTHLQRGDADEAAHIAVSALNSLGSLQSARVRSYVRDLASRFDRVGDGPATRQFNRHAAALLAG
ncbi:MAG: hypothetical protein ACFCUP_04070 [Actinomycetales bacterium]